MKTDLKIIVLPTVILCLIGIWFFIKQGNTELDTKKNEVLLSNDLLLRTTTKDDSVSFEETSNHHDENIEEQIDNEIVKPVIVYDGLTKEELVKKLNDHLHSTLEGTGEIFANYALNLSIDPYLAVAIVLHETGCSWNCSTLVKECNNVGGLKGNPKCGGGSYASFTTLEEGISSFMNNLYQNYYAYGLTTPETINSKYASSTTWASKINYYINQIKAS